MKKAILVTSSLLLSLGATAETIVVTASKIPIPLEKTANSVSIITSKEIERSSATDLPTLLKKTSGISISQTGTKGSQASVFLRGSNSSDYILIVDGIQMNDPSRMGRSASLEHISLDDIESIEIMKGSQSVLYGSDAAGGVISIKTKSASSKKVAADLSGSAGTGNYYQARASLSGTLSNTKYFISTELSGENAQSSAKGDGFDKDSEKFKNITAKVDSQISEDLSLKLITSAYMNDVELDDGSGVDDRERTLFSKGISAGAEAKLLYLDGLADITFSGSKTRFDRRDTDDSYPAVFRGETSHLELQNNLYLGDHHTVATGLEYEREEDLTSSTKLSSSTLNTKSIFGLYQYNSEGAFATAGIRLDYHSSFGEQLTYKLAPGYYFAGTKTKLFANYSTSFKSPSLYYLYESAWGSGNADLNPEKGYTAELGISQNFLSRNDFELVSFYTKNDESIIYGPSNKYINGGKQTAKGFEAEYRFSHPRFSFISNYTYTLARDKDGKSLLKRSKHMGSLGFDIATFDNLSAGADLTYKGEREDYKNGTENYKLGGYTLVGLHLNYSPLKSLKLWAKLTNIFDKEYEDVKGYESYGRMAKAGLKWSF